MKRKLVLVGLLFITFLAFTGCMRAQEEVEKTEVTEETIIVEESPSDHPNESTLENEAFDTTGTKKVGSDAFGYVNVPNSWGNFDDVDLPEDTTVIQFSDPLGFDIITLNAWEFTGADAEQNASALWGRLEEEGAKNVDGAKVQIGEYDAFQVYGFYEVDNKMLVMWLFDTEDGMSHYISAESSLEGIMSIVDMVENTYELNL